MFKNIFNFKEFFGGWSRFEIKYISILLFLQFLAYFIAPDSLIGMISGVSGVICLVYGMKGRKLTFIFGFIQCIAMSYIAFRAHAYGSFLMNLIYVISQPIGFFMWGEDEAVNSFSKKTKIKIFALAVLAWFIGWMVLAKIGGELPYFDSINLVISLIAQILYVLKYKENWSLWIFVNIANLVFWTILTFKILRGESENSSFGECLSQVALQAALLFNSVYALRVWDRYSKNVK